MFVFFGLNFYFILDDKDHPAADENEELLQKDRRIFPGFVFVLDEGDDDFLRQRVIDMPESEVAGTHNNEEGLQQQAQSQSQ